MVDDKDDVTQLEEELEEELEVELDEELDEELEEELEEEAVAGGPFFIRLLALSSSAVNNERLACNVAMSFSSGQ